MGWVGLGWVWFGWVGVGLGWLGSVGLGWVGLGWLGLVGLGWFGLVWVGLDSPRRPLKSPLRHPKRAQEGPENLPRQVAHVGPPASFKIEPCLRENHTGH